MKALWVGAVAVVAVSVAVVALTPRKAQAQPPVLDPESCLSAEGPTQFGPLPGIVAYVGGGAPGQKLPTIVHLHGLGNTPQQQQIKIAQRIDVPARAVLLQGPTKHGDGYGWTTERCLSKDQDKLASQISWTTDRLAEALDVIVTCYGPVVLSGFSNGATQVYAVAARRLAGVTKVIAVSGCLPAALRSAEMLPTIGVHGQRDQTVPYVQTAAWAAANPNIRWITTEDAHSPSDSTLDLWSGLVEEAFS